MVIEIDNMHRGKESRSCPPPPANWAVRPLASRVRRVPREEEEKKKREEENRASKD